MFGRLNLKIGGVLLVLGGAMFVWGTARPSPLYYRFVDEVVSDAQKFRKKGLLLDVHGCVVHGSIKRRTGTDEYRFRLASRPDRPPAAITVRYTGWVPDLFGSDVEIVAKGRLGCDGTLDVVPDGIMARCPSKYAADLNPNSGSTDRACTCSEPRS